ncbi:MAG: hypothetical protein NC089_10670 [Bacteroides sp.]|nr:hypothetical protein [Bacteroides sp.]MCM1550242.1 hypothetical protein [Clostridium sp.]
MKRIKEILHAERIVAKEDFDWALEEATIMSLQQLIKCTNLQIKMGMNQI